MNSVGTLASRLEMSNKQVPFNRSFRIDFLSHLNTHQRTRHQHVRGLTDNNLHALTYSFTSSFWVKGSVTIRLYDWLLSHTWHSWPGA